MTDDPADETEEQRRLRLERQRVRPEEEERKSPRPAEERMGESPPEAGPPPR